MTFSADCSNMLVDGKEDALGVSVPRIHSVRTGLARTKIELNGRELIHFGSNDYLGLAADPRIVAALTEAVRQYGWGSTASPSVGGRGVLHEQLEQRLASFVDAEAVILYSSGYAANLDAIRELVGEGDAIFCDDQNHISILDGAKLSGAAVYPYRHGDCDHLSSLMQAGRHHRRRLIATESLFGSDGSLASLQDLAEIAERHDAMLFVDEAHAIGTQGNRGEGAAASLGHRDCLVARIGTLGKALGGMGGFVAGRTSLVKALATRPRGYQHSTSLPAAACAAALAAVEIIVGEPDRRAVLFERAAGVRGELLRQGWNVRTSASHIIPVWIEDARRAEAIAASLRDTGFYLPCVVPPHAAAGRSMLRLRINCGHEPEVIEGLLSSFARSA